MNHDPLKHRNVLSLADLGPRDVAFLLALARQLKQAREAGTEQPRLRGRNIGVLGGSEAPDEAFATAVAELGARLAAIPPDLSPAGDRAALRQAAQLLSRLYDAIDCPNCDARTLAELSRLCSVPVFSGLSTARHPAHALGQLLALQESTNRPLRGLHIAWRGDPADPAGAALRQAATLAGVTVQGEADGEADFVFESHAGHAEMAGHPETFANRVHTTKALLVATLA